MAQLNSTKKTVQNLQLDTPMSAVLSQLKPNAIKERETLRMGDVEFKILFIATDREHLLGSEYKALCTPLIFTDDKLIGKTRKKYDLIYSQCWHHVLLKRFSKQEADLIIEGRLAVGMSEDALMAIFIGQPKRYIRSITRNFNSPNAVRIYQALDDGKTYNLYVLNGKLIKFENGLNTF